ncbi:MAG: hypothetical protein ABW000_25005 [Actinoplanes sp.]
MDRALTAAERLAVRPKNLLTNSNSNLARDGILSWTLPAGPVRMGDGRTFNPCPSAGICLQACYAMNGTYRIPSVRERHQRNLAYVLDDLPGWTAQMIAEINAKRRPVIVRIHDAGDFFSDEYLAGWRRVWDACPASRFYAYTKEADRIERLVAPKPPANFRWVYSYGGTQDTRLDPAVHRVADVFPSVEALQGAHHHDQADSDLLAVDGPSPVGMAANRIPKVLALLGSRTFRTWQQEADAERVALRQRRQVRFTGDADPWGPLVDRLLHDAI